jgi:hypothetical protein
MAVMNFALLDGDQVDEVYKFLEWAPGRNL